MNLYNDDDRIIETAVNLCCSFYDSDLDLPNITRARAARAIATAAPSTLNEAFVAIMDNPKPFYDALRVAGLDDWAARGRLSNLPIAAAGGYGLKPKDFQV